MTWISLFALLAAAGVVQAVVPPVSALGRAPLPVLASLVVYYALTRPIGFAIASAVLAGMVHDSLGRVPLGYSSLCFGVGAWLIHRFQTDVFAWEAVTHMVLGAFLAGGSTLILSGLLQVTGQISISPGHAVVKMLGAALLGAVLTPWVCASAEGLDRQLDVLESERR